MTQTTILMFHPEPARSRVNRALADAARAVPGVRLHDMHAAEGPDGRFDTDAEVARLLAAERLVLQFPVQWYSQPALMRAWQDAVLTRMFYIRPAEGAALAGRSLHLAVTAGNVAQAYGPEGANLFALEALLAPLQAVAHRCGYLWQPPFVVYGAARLDDAGLAQEAARYAGWLAGLDAEPDLAEPGLTQPGLAQPGLAQPDQAA